MTQAPHELDVRPILRAGGEPFSAIMEAVNGLAAGQSFRLLATFEPDLSTLCWPREASTTRRERSAVAIGR